MKSIQYERDMITTRIRDSRDRLREQGRWLGGAAPYGYKTVSRDGGKYLAEDPDTGWRVRDLVKRAIDGTPLVVLVHELNSEGVPSPVAHARIRAGKNPANAKTGKVPQWTVSVLRNLLTSPTLTGTLMHDPRSPEQKKDANGKRIKLRAHELRPVLDENGDPVKVGPELISEAEHRAVKAAIENRAAPPRSRATATLLLHVAHCETCGGPLYFNRRRYANGLNADAYGCGRYDKAKGCKVNISAKYLEPHVRDEVMRVLGKRPFMRPVAETGDVRAEIAETESGIETLAASLVKLRAGSKSANAVDAQLEALERKLDRLKESQGSAEGPRWEPTGRTFAEEWEARDVPGRRALLLSVGVRVTVGPTRKRRWDPERVTVDIAGPEWLQEDPHAAMLADIAEQEANAEVEPLNAA